MKEKQEPRVARWMLEHLVPTQRWSESLSGDLAEQWGRRSHAWYWRQVAGALVTGWAQEIYRLRLAIVFALLFVFPESLFWVYGTRVGPYSKFLVWSVMLPWPWSFVVQLGMNLAVEFLFIWAGYAVYLAAVWVVSRPVRFGRAMRGLLAGVWVNVVAQICATVVASFMTFAPVNVKTVSDLEVLFAPHAILFGIPVVLAVVCAIRTAIPVGGRNSHCVTGV